MPEHVLPHSVKSGRQVNPHHNTQVLFTFHRTYRCLDNLQDTDALATVDIILNAQVV